MKQNDLNELMSRENLDETELQHIPFATTEYVSLALKHYSGALRIPEDTLFDGLTIDRETILNRKDWVYGRDYMRFHRNAFKNLDIYLNFRLFKHVGARNSTVSKTLFHPFISLLTFGFIKKNASRLFRFFNNAVDLELIPYDRNKYYMTLKSRPFAKQVLMGHECRLLEGVFTSFLKALRIETVSSNHLICEKSLKNIVTEFYAAYGFDYKDDGRYIYINSWRIGKRVRLKSRHIDGQAVFTSQIDTASTEPNAIVIIEDFNYSGHQFFRKGEVFDAPYCVVDLEIKDSGYFQRLFRRVKGWLNIRKILMEEMAQEIEISNRHLHRMHRLSEELRTERDSFEKKVEERTLELIEANEQLQELNHRRTDFIASVTHELRTPLTLIKSQVEAISEGMFGDSIDRGSDVLTSIKKNADILYQLTAEFLQFSRFDSKKMALKIVSVKLDEFVLHTVRQFEPLLVTHGLSCQFVNRAPEILVNVDPIIFEKAISNLLTNAIKFTPYNGKITVIISENKDDDEIEITVRDTGSGIPEEFLNVIFERYRQVDHVNAREGSGIGLALAKKIVELHKGRISVSSEEGKGSDFTIHLPRQIEPVITAKYILRESFRNTVPTYLNIDNQPFDGNADPDVSLDEKKRNILIVDDHPELLDFLKRVLQEEYNVFLAEDGVSALNVVMENDIEIIVADIMMPGLDGTELVRKLRSDKRTDWIPILMLTAYSDFGIKMKSFASGADDFLTKPFQPLELLARIRSLAKRAGKPKEKITLVDKRVTEQTRQAIEKAMAYVKTRYSENFSRDELAAAVEISPDHFSRMFKKYTGKKISQYINELRIEEAVRLIMEKPDIKIIDLAFDVGFENLRSFNKVFKGITGKSPSQFKKNRGLNTRLL